MDTETFTQARAAFDRHVAKFRDDAGTLPFALEAKFKHTGEVCEITEKIVAGEARFSPRDTLVFRLCSLFQTFRASTSSPSSKRSLTVIRSTTATAAPP